jgi:hypothetical protein
MFVLLSCIDCVVWKGEMLLSIRWHRGKCGIVLLAIINNNCRSRTVVVVVVGHATCNMVMTGKAL